MGTKPSLKGQLVLEYLNKFPDMADAGLSKLIYKKNTEIFKDVEQVRGVVRYYRGHMGGKLRDHMNKDYKEAAFADSRIWEEANTDLEEKKYIPYTLPTGEDNILILPDIHIPYHDPKAIKLAIEYGKAEDVNTIILSGDQIDFYAISSFVKHPHKPSIAYEIDVLKRFLRELRDEFPHARIYFKEGNHEERWYKYLYTKAPEIFDIQMMELDDILQMTAIGITPIKDRRRIITGNYNIFHGHEVNVSSMLYPAAALYRKTKVNSICGHLHRSDDYTVMDVNKNRVKTHVMGCLCSLLPEFALYNGWNLGFGHLKIKNGTGKFNNIVIEDYKIV